VLVAEGGCAEDAAALGASRKAVDGVTASLPAQFKGKVQGRRTTRGCVERT
jgi:hypothetical protein